MKTLRIKAYRFNELNKDAQNKAIIDRIKVEIPLIQDEYNSFWDVMQKMEKMKTPWFLAETIFHDENLKQVIIDELADEEFFFTVDGTMVVNAYAK